MIKLIAMMLSGLLVGTNYTAIVPFYPTIAHDKGLGPAIIGVILAAMPFASLVTSPYIAKNMYRVSRLSALIFSVVLTAIASFAIAFSLEFDYVAFGIIGFIARLLSGFSLALNSIASFSMMSADFPHILEKAIGYFELVSSFGYAFGPLMMSVLYTTVGAELSFIIYGCFFALSSIPFFFLDTSKDPEASHEIEISMASLMKDNLFIANIGGLLLVNIADGGFDVLIALHLKELGVSDGATGVIYSICTISYLIFAVIPAYVPQSVPRKYIVLAGLVASSLAYFFMGPLFFLPSYVWIIAMGVFFVGLGYAISYSKL
mmetsp:Transcript_15526/g.28151  ORF Transcript_15526/g.28151 Transcript_15526/m.28151 type:complete len:318 (-) Transcript_15526:1222-2175(-)